MPGSHALPSMNSCPLLPLQDHAQARRQFVGKHEAPIFPVDLLPYRTETENEIRVISFRKATKREANLYFQQIQD
jgi:uncharacterized DUF497 family protein